MSSITPTMYISIALLLITSMWVSITISIGLAILAPFVICVIIFLVTSNLRHTLPVIVIIMIKFLDWTFFQMFQGMVVVGVWLLMVFKHRLKNLWRSSFYIFIWSDFFLLSFISNCLLLVVIVAAWSYFRILFQFFPGADSFRDIFTGLENLFYFLRRFEELLVRVFEMVQIWGHAFPHHYRIFQRLHSHYIVILSPTISSFMGLPSHTATHYRHHVHEKCLWRVSR